MSCHPAEGGRISFAVPGPNKDCGRVEPDGEQKHPLSQTQTWQLTGLAEEVQAEQEKHDEAEERRIWRQPVQSSVGT